MTAESRIREILEEALDSGATPEELCADEPDLLPAVRERLQRLRCLSDQVDQLFPSSNAGAVGATGLGTPSETSLPTIDGYEVQGILGHGGMGVVYRAR